MTQCDLKRRYTLALYSISFFIFHCFLLLHIHADDGLFTEQVYQQELCDNYNLPVAN